uniref:Uncharacterized protein n=1 Tax=Oryza glumipatula TaxID=40148 RepID=A0A0D9Y3L5_9ORYZ
MSLRVARAGAGHCFQAARQARRQELGAGKLIYFSRLQLCPAIRNSLQRVVANGMVERRGSEDGGGSGPKVDGDVQGIAAADPGILAWHRDNDERQRKWAANLRGTPPGHFILRAFNQLYGIFC